MINYIIIRTIGILLASYITHVGVPIALAWQTGWIAFLTALFLAVINHTIKPAIDFLSMPINLFTMGFFSLFVNGLIIVAATHVVHGFVIPSFLMAIYFATVLALINWVLHIFE